MISCSTAKDQPWAAAGHEVAWEQFALSFLDEAPVPQSSTLPLKVEEEDGSMKFSGDGFVYTINKSDGVISSMLIDGEELISKGPRLNVWRAPLANDLDSWNFWHTEMGHVTDGMGKEAANGWRSIGLDQLKQEVDQFESEIGDDQAEVWVEASVHARNHTTGFKVYYQYTIRGNGQLEIATRVSPRGNMTRWIPRVGLQMELPRQFQRMEWFGRGPFENYPDRKTGAKFGRYNTTADADYVPYIIPQDYGNRSDVHWIRVTDDSGTGLLITGEETFNTSLQKYSTEKLDRAHYPFQLSREYVVTLNLDHRVTGVGGTALSVLNPYQVLPGAYDFTFKIQPIK